MFFQAFASVPVPPDAVPANGTDRHLVIYQPSTDTMWEMWEAYNTTGNWTCSWGGKISNMSRSDGIVPIVGGEKWGATATSLPLLGGLMTVEELTNLYIPHVLAFAIPYSQPTPNWSWPALRTDGRGTIDPVFPLEGQRFRLPASLNITALGLTPVMQAIVTAARDYGLVIRDTAGAVVIYAEQPRSGEPNPYFGTTGIWENKGIPSLINSFPWAQLQALDDNYRNPGTCPSPGGWINCTAFVSIISLMGIVGH